MSINAAASTSVSSSSQVSTSAGAENTKKTDSSSSSFKDEMDKVSSENSKDKASDNKSDEVAEKKNTEDNSIKDNMKNEEDDNNNLTINGQIEYEKFASMSLLDANSMLQNNIYQMTNREATVMTVELSSVEDNSNDSLMFNSLSMTQADAEFFVNLTQNNDVSMQNITTQAQNLLNQGTDVREVQQNVKISETLLNALNTAKENNQPLRIDFDQNIAVILRVGKDGALAANFIPGDKAVEQYLRNNIESLKNTFRENDLPYTDLSYSNRGSKQQKENRRNKQ